MSVVSDPFSPLPAGFFRRAPEKVARDLLGRYLVRRCPGQRLVLRLVETEAYCGESDRASHAWKGPVSARSRRLFRDGGHAYVYLIYGLHRCLNAVTGTAEDGTAVLLRAGAPIEGAEQMAAKRGLRRAFLPGDLAGGPGKLCKALGIGLEHDGLSLWSNDELTITHGTPAPPGEIATGPRIGIDYAGDAASWPLRFAIAGDPEMSRPRLGDLDVAGVEQAPEDQQGVELGHRADLDQ